MFKTTSVTDLALSFPLFLGFPFFQREFNSDFFLMRGRAFFCVSFFSPFFSAVPLSWFLQEVDCSFSFTGPLVPLPFFGLNYSPFPCNMTDTVAVSLE